MRQEVARNRPHDGERSDSPRAGLSDGVTIRRWPSFSSMAAGWWWSCLPTRAPVAPRFCWRIAACRSRRW